MKLEQKRVEYQIIYGLREDWLRAQKQIAEIEEMCSADPDPSIAELAMDDKKHHQAQIDMAMNQIKEFIIPPDEADIANAILELRAGTGGDEAGFFTRELLQMYQKYCVLSKWQCELLSLSEDEWRENSVREATLSITGAGAFGRLKFEGGVHRVQRVPANERQGRIHSSTCTVAILPRPVNERQPIPDREIRIDSYKASGPGGQHVNKTNSAIRVVHLPTGITVCIQDERNQQLNKQRALEILEARLFQRRREANEAQRRATRKTQIGTAERADKIRTFNFPQARVTDHRVNHSVFDLESFMRGERLDEFIELLRIQEEQARLDEFLESKQHL